MRCSKSKHGGCSNVPIAVWLCVTTASSSYLLQGRQRVPCALGTSLSEKDSLYKQKAAWMADERWRSHLGRLKAIVSAGHKPLQPSELAEISRRWPVAALRRETPPASPASDDRGPATANDVATAVYQSSMQTHKSFTELRKRQNAIDDKVVARSIKANVTKPVLERGDTVRLVVSALKNPATGGDATIVEGCEFLENEKLWFPCGSVAAEEIKQQAKNKTPVYRWFSKAVFQVADRIGESAHDARDMPPEEGDSAPVSIDLYASTYELQLVHDGRGRLQVPLTIKNSGGKNKRFWRDQLLLVTNTLYRTRGSQAMDAWLSSGHKMPFRLMA